MEPHLERVEVEGAVTDDDDLPVERRTGRQPLTQLRELGEVAQERPGVAAPEVELPSNLLEDAAEAVPFGLVLPVVPLGKLVDELRLHGREGKRARWHGGAGYPRNQVQPFPV